MSRWDRCFHLVQSRSSFRIGREPRIAFTFLSSVENLSLTRNMIVGSWPTGVANLARLPFLPIFVFDGRNRPKMKRGSKIGKSGAHSLTTNLKKLLEVFGMEYREAEGEAEAELAYLN